jgi:hypothetical protein
MDFGPEIEKLMGPFYDRYGTPVSFGRFAELKFRDGERVDVVALTQHDDVEISTVWLGWREGLDRHGRPRIFETVIFTEDDARVYGRYATEDEAVAGHAAAVRALTVGAIRTGDGDV